jgi:SAM-dependent methyltransferase
VSGNAEARSLNTPEAWSARADEPTSLGAVMWSAQGQKDRFEAALDALKGSLSTSLLDFGCGTGAFSEHIPSHEYFGYDWSQSMVQRARDEHPDHEFTSALSWRRFDAVVCIGTFNLPGSTYETWRTLMSLWEITDRVLVASLYCGEDESCLRYDEYDLCDFARNHADRWRVEKHRHNDLLLVMWR